jgi:hypothetical protein
VEKLTASHIGDERHLRDGLTGADAQFRQSRQKAWGQIVHAEIADIL